MTQMYRFVVIFHLCMCLTEVYWAKIKTPGGFWDKPIFLSFGL